MVLSRRLCVRKPNARSGWGTRESTHDTVCCWSLCTTFCEVHGIGIGLRCWKKVARCRMSTPRRVGIQMGRSRRYNSCACYGPLHGIYMCAYCICYTVDVYLGGAAAICTRAAIFRTNVTILNQRALCLPSYFRVHHAFRDTV